MLLGIRGVVVCVRAVSEPECLAACTLSWSVFRRLYVVQNIIMHFTKACHWTVILAY